MLDNIEILLGQEEVALRIKELGAEIAAYYAGEEVLVVGILKGSFMFMADLIRAINGPVTVDFMAVSSYGDAFESTGQVKILKDLDISLEGKNVLIAEDIIDTGLTLNYIRSLLQERNPKSLKICTLLDKPSRRTVELTPDFTGFTIENRFVLGFGLDYYDLWRNLPAVYALKA